MPQCGAGARKDPCALCRSRPHDSGKDESEVVLKLGACSSRRGRDAPLLAAKLQTWRPKCGKLLRANNTLDLVEQPKCEISSAIQM